MLSSSTDFGFFSSSLAPSPSSVIVKTRPRPPPSLHGSSTTTTPIHSSPLLRHTSSPPFSSPLSEPPSPPTKKRKRLGKDSDSAPPPSRELKRPRAHPKKKPRKRNSSPTTLTRVPSRAQSRQSLLAPSPEPIYRSDRSRSTSLFPGLDSDTPLFQRRWRIDEDGHPGNSFLSSEIIVRRLIKSYKTCVYNPPRRFI